MFTLAGCFYNSRITIIFFYLNIQVQLFLMSLDVWLVVGLELEGLGFKTMKFFYFLVTETLRQNKLDCL